MTLLIEARAFLDKNKGLKFDTFSDAFQKLPEPLQDAVAEEQAVRSRAERTKLFHEEGKPVEGSRKEHLSPSGKYKLVTECYGFKKGWNYSKGSVFRQGEDEPLFEVYRNYGHFTFLFVEDHPNSHAYLVCGEDYQGQTVLELDTGKRKDYLPRDGIVGHGFCWTAKRFNATSQILIVDGCYWACPYEYRFYDFSNPMAGWPEIESEHYIDSSERWPEIHEDGTIQCFHLPYWSEDEEEDDEEKALEDRSLASVQTFRREGLKLILVEEWVSETEKKRRADNIEARQKYEQWLQDFRDGDPLYLALSEHLKDPAFKTAAQNISIGVTYKDWCPDFDGNERRFCRRIVQQPKGTQPKFTMDLEWAVDTGPIKLVVYKDGKHIENKFFGHSVEELAQTIAYAKALLGGVS